MGFTTSKSDLTSSHVYSSNISIKEVTSNINIPMVRKVVCRDIFPGMKFVNLSKGFQEPTDRVFEKPNNPYYIIFPKLGMYFSIFLFGARILLEFL